MAEIPKQHIIDTDIQLHRRIGDPAVRDAANKELDKLTDAYLTLFSFLEFKGNYIQDLVLLSNKLKHSASMEETFYRVQNTGGRKAARMLASLYRYLSIDLTKPWQKIQGALLTRVDAEVKSAWNWFGEGFKGILDDTKCTRAREAPVARGKNWIVSIPKCRRSNTDCNVRLFFESKNSHMQGIIDHLSSLTAYRRTAELDRILEVVKKTVDSNAFPWEGTTCRSVGDLIIALHCGEDYSILSSNKKEHSELAASIGYEFIEFKVTDYRIH